MNGKTRLSLGLLAAVLVLPWNDASAGPLREQLRERLQERRALQGNDSGTAQDDLADMGGNALSCAEWSKKVERLQRRASGRNAGPAPDLRDVAYGPLARHKLDVYRPKRVEEQSGGKEGAPVILMVHGGGWCVGDKAGAKVVANKVARWVPKGFIVVSANYPMVGDGSDALAQAAHIARATAFVQARAREWGGDPQRVVLMGHSAGAHLVSLVNADTRIRRANGMGEILGAVSLDAGAIDVVRQMPNVYSFLKVRYQEAFGSTETQWIAASPFHRLDRTAAPWLGVCSTTRKDDPCGQAKAYVEKSNALGVRASALPQKKSHGAINDGLGLPNDYTSDVESFLASLDPVVARLLR